MSAERANDGKSEAGDCRTLDNRRKRAASPEKGHYLRAPVTKVAVNDRPRKKRCDIQDMTRPLKKWLVCHRKYPYPSQNDKKKLAELSHMNYTQVSNWFTNARRRLKKTVQIRDFTWEKSICLYNQYAESNCEPLICSDDEGNFGDTDAADGEQDEGNFDDTDAEDDTEEETPVSSARNSVHAISIGNGNAMMPDSALKATDDNDGVVLPKFSTDSDRVMTRQQAQNQSSQVVDYWGAEGSAFHPPQFKKAMMQRFLDCCPDNSSVTSSAMLVWPQANAGNFAFEARYRHASGSTDCDDRSSSYFSSCRPSPTAELLFSDESEFSHFWPSGRVQRQSATTSKKKQDDDLDLLEISAAMGLATMKQNNSHKQGRGTSLARK